MRRCETAHTYIIPSLDDNYFALDGKADSL